MRVFSPVYPWIYVCVFSYVEVSLLFLIVHHRETTRPSADQEKVTLIGTQREKWSITSRRFNFETLSDFLFRLFFLLQNCPGAIRYPFPRHRLFIAFISHFLSSFLFYFLHFVLSFFPSLFSLFLFFFSFFLLFAKRSYVQTLITLHTFHFDKTPRSLFAMPFAYWSSIFC